jgi:hypothetical protein
VDGWERLGEWAAALLVASTAWLTGLAADGASPSASSETTTPILLAWAQDATETTIQPVDEDDVETLDEGLPPTEQETLDQGAQGTVPLDPTGQEDIELLDQGAPPIAAAPVSAEPVVVAAEPAPAPAPLTATVPVEAAAAPAGPTLPPGFGRGRVHVAAGRAGFPVGLETCHVGAVTGRAYVGINCGDHDDSFVGHAPSFDDFPFVVDAEFPFDDDSEVLPIVTTEPEETTTGIFVSSATGSDRFLVEDPSSPNVEADGAASVTLAQRTRDREPRVRVDTRNKDSERTRTSDKRGRSSVSYQRADDSGGDVQTESKKKQTAKDRKQDGKEKAKGKGKDKGKDKEKKRDKGKKKSEKKRSGHNR